LTQAGTPSKDVIEEFLAEERARRRATLEAAYDNNSNPSNEPDPSGTHNQGHFKYSKSKAEKHLDNWDKRGHDATTFPKITRNDDYLSWKETFTQLLKNERMLFFTDPDPKYEKDNIIDEFELELYEQKQRPNKSTRGYSHPAVIIADNDDRGGERKHQTRMPTVWNSKSIQYMKGMYRT